MVFTASLMLHEPLRLTVTDDRGNTASGEGAEPELAFHQETTATVMQTELYKTGGTPFTCQEVHSRIEKGIYLNPQEIGTLRDELLRQLMGKRVYLEPRAESVVDALPRAAGPTEPPVLTVSVRTCAQLSPRLLALAPPVLYIPLEEAVSGAPALEPFLSSKDISVCAALPPVLYDSELGRVTELLIKARQLGINEVLAGHMGHVIFARQLGFAVRGDTSLNLKNGPSLAVMRGLRLKSAALSMELSAARVRGISKYLDTELVVYGRMPLMHTAGCLIKAQTGVCSCDSFSGLTDKSGFVHPVTREYGCRNTLWSEKKLHLAHRSREYLSSGLWGVRLSFTTENAAECARIAERYLELGGYEPNASTEGLY